MQTSVKKSNPEQCCAQAEGEVRNVHRAWEITAFAMPVNIVIKPPSLKRVKPKAE